MYMVYNLYVEKEGNFLALWGGQRSRWLGMVP